MIFYMGVSHLWQFEFEKATLYLQKVLTMVPQHRAAQEYLGWIAALQGQYERALALFAQIEPFGYRLHRTTCQGWVYAKMGEVEKANACLEELKTFHGQSPQGIGLTVDLAVLHTAMEDFDNAFH